MMKKISIAFVAAAMVLAIAGCSSIADCTKYNGLNGTVTNDRALTHLNSRINGVYLFGFVPLFSGAVAKPNYTAMFTNTSTIDNAFFQMMIYARNKGATAVIDVNSTSGTTMLIPFLLYMRTAETSGTAVVQPEYANAATGTTAGAATEY